jgi:NAD(P)-dependent dehydrogenase (short-subunit alcohol dehydrogenase family)
MWSRSLRGDVLNRMRTVLVTGGTGRIGKILAQGFANNGWEVIITSRDAKRAAATAEGLTIAAKNKVYGLPLDFTVPDSLQHFVDLLHTKEFKIACLINNARGLDSLQVDANGDPSLDHWLREYQVNVALPYQLSMTLARAEFGLESVINISSMYGVVAANPSLYDHPEVQSPIHYSVSKAALIHLTKELGVRLAPRKIRVNAISYGGVAGRVDPEFQKRYARLTPIGRMLNNEDLFSPALFLADSSLAVTGHNLVVDGGWSIW